MRRNPLLCRIAHRWRHHKTEDLGRAVSYTQCCARCGMHRLYVETGGRSWDMWSEPFFPNDHCSVTGGAQQQTDHE